MGNGTLILSNRKKTQEKSEAESKRKGKSDEVVREMFVPPIIERMVFGQD